MYLYLYSFGAHVDKISVMVVGMYCGPPSPSPSPSHPHFHNCSGCCPTAPLLLLFAARWVCKTIYMNNYGFGPWNRSPRILGPNIGCLLGPKIGCLLGPLVEKITNRGCSLYGPVWY